MSNGGKAFDAKYLAGFTFDPDDLHIIFDKKDPLYDPGAHEELKPEFVESIRQLGIGQAVLIRKNADGKPEVVDGRKRVRAARLLNSGSAQFLPNEKIMVPCTTRRGDAPSAYLMTIALNEHRKAPDPRIAKIAKAQRMANLAIPEGDIALALGVSPKTVKRLLNADPKPPARKARSKARGPSTRVIRDCAGRINKADLSPDARSILQWVAGELPTEALQKELPGLFAE